MSISYIWGRSLINMVGLRKSILWMQVVRFSHWCCGFQSSGMWWHVAEPVVSDVSKFSNIIFSFRTCGPLNITAQHPVNNQEPLSVMQHDIPKSHNPHY
jgi:hypothetical protein